MTVRKLARLFFALIATGVGLTEAKAQTEFPPAYNNQAHYAVGDLVTDYGNIYRCESTVTKPYLDPSKTYQNWELFYVRSSTTIPVGVGQTFPDLATAWSYVRNCRIAEAAYLHLSILTTKGDLNESFSAPLNLDHASGSQISIIGDQSTSINLSFPSSNGLTLDSNHSLGHVSNMNLTGGTANDGIYTAGGASLVDAEGLTVNGFAYQIYADQSSNINFGQNIVLSGGVNECCHADQGATIVFGSNLTASQSSQSGTCLDAQRGAKITAEISTLSGAFNGVLAQFGGYVDVGGASISNCVIGGESNNGTIVTTGGAFARNTVDLDAQYNGVILAIGASGLDITMEHGGTVFTS